VPLIGLLLGFVVTAHAGTVLSLDEAFKLDDQADPEMRVITRDMIAPDARWTAIDEHAMRNLGEELLDVRPLMHKFDGELEIMARLEAAGQNVHVLRDEEERRLMYVALAFEGFAVERYFQAELATDPSAEPYRTVVGDRIEVKAWVDAIALDPFREPTRLDISELPELEAFKQTRDRLLYAKRATLRFDDLPADAQVVVDGHPQDPAVVADGVPLLPGRHLAAVIVAGRIVDREDFRLQAGDTRTVAVPPPPAEMDLLEAALVGTPPTASLPARLAATLSRLPSPVRIAVPSDEGTVLYRLSGSDLVRIDPERTDHRGDVAIDTWVGAAYVHDRSYLQLNDGAPDAGTTENAGAPLLGVAAMWSLAQLTTDDADASRLEVGAGIDLPVPAGEWHHVPLGDSQLRVRPYPFVAFGTPMVQATVGLFAPWHLGAGARVALPLAGESRLLIGADLGVVRLTKVAGPVQPALPQSAFVAVSSRFGR
jgi:hypothetical protein